ncbi:MAG: hypothetical protein GXO06_05770 [Epsilonproteobacteria bacterium]|nr:hypothetical protein [Campylobacterota bacterium]
MSIYRGIFVSSIIGISSIVSGCGSSSSSGSTITDSGGDTELSDSYKDSKYGIIDYKRLTEYIDDWANSRPEGVDGKLIIIQAGKSSSGKVLKSNGKDVFTYLIPAGGACNPSYMRFDGLSNIPGATLDGNGIDAMINKFHINPEKDFVLFAVGVGSTSVRDVVRSLWTLNYWGWSHNQIAMLNGSIDYGFSKFNGLDSYLVDNPSVAPESPSNYSVKSLKRDRTALHIYIDDMMKIASMDDKSGYFIADARGTSEYEGLKRSKSGDKSCGVNRDEQCYSPYQGHIRGAVDFPYTELLVMDDQIDDVNGDGEINEADASFKFKSPIELEKIYSQKGYRDGDRVITYCRTGRKATLIAFTSNFILDYNVSMYDGSWIEWGEMANREDVDGKTILPEDSRWVTDNPKYSVNLGYTEPEYTQSAEPYEINSSAKDAQLIKLEDMAYLDL